MSAIISRLATRFSQIAVVGNARVVSSSSGARALSTSLFARNGSNNNDGAAAAAEQQEEEVDDEEYDEEEYEDEEEYDEDEEEYDEDEADEEEYEDEYEDEYEEEDPNSERLSSIKQALESEFAFRGVPGRYSKALLASAIDARCEPEVRDDLVQLDKQLQSNYEFRSMFHRFPLEDMEASQVTKIFLEELRSQGHTHHFGAIARTYEAAAREILNEQHYTLVTPAPLSAADLAKVTEIVGEGSTGKQVIKNEVDANLLGGFVIHNNEYVFDMSVKTLLNRFFTEKQQELEVEQEKRLAKLNEQVLLTGTPSNTVFLKRVNDTLIELEKQCGLDQLNA